MKTRTRPTGVALALCLLLPLAASTLPAPAAATAMTPQQIADGVRDATVAAKHLSAAKSRAATMRAAINGMKAQAAALRQHLGNDLPPPRKTAVLAAIAAIETRATAARRGYDALNGQIGKTLDAANAAKRATNPVTAGPVHANLARQVAFLQVSLHASQQEVNGIQQLLQQQVPAQSQASTYNQAYLALAQQLAASHAIVSAIIASMR